MIGVVYHYSCSSGLVTLSNEYQLHYYFCFVNVANASKALEVPPSNLPNDITRKHADNKVKVKECKHRVYGEYN